MGGCNGGRGVLAVYRLDGGGLQTLRYQYRLIQHDNPRGHSGSHRLPGFAFTAARPGPPETQRLGARAEETEMEAWEA